MGVLTCLLGLGCTVPVQATEHACEDGRWVLRDGDETLVLEDCARAGLRCEPSGCVGCVTGRTQCDGDMVTTCDGTAWVGGEDCSLVEGAGCVAGSCRNLCDAARADRSYLGCEYHAVTTLNSLLPAGFDMGVVVANPSRGVAHVRIDRGELHERIELAPGETRSVLLPIVPELGRAQWRSALVPDGAYTVRSDRPIAAYQYDPLEFRRSPECVFTGTSDDLGCFSFTNDASLLLPDHAVGTDYLIDTRGGASGARASFVTIVAIEDTTVDVRAPAALARSEDEALPAWPADAARQIALHAGDVLQLVSDGGDLAGTELHASAPVLVFGGHDCANVPESARACDHLEEVMLPLDSWGRTAVVALPQVEDDQPIVVRVISSIDDNEITLSGIDRPFTLDRGERFELLTTDDLVVSASGPILVTEYMVGAALFDLGGGKGDPSMGTAPFVEQFRGRYDFAVPATYTDDFIAVVAPADGEVLLDGMAIDAWEPLEDYRVARVRMSPGTHRLDASRGAGLTLYGVAPFTSYLLPGGLDVEPLR